MSKYNFGDMVEVLYCMKWTRAVIISHPDEEKLYQVFLYEFKILQKVKKTQIRFCDSNNDTWNHDPESNPGHSNKVLVRFNNQTQTGFKVAGGWWHGNTFVSSETGIQGWCEFPKWVKSSKKFWFRNARNEAWHITTHKVISFCAVTGGACIYTETAKDATRIYNKILKEVKETVLEKLRTMV